MGGGGEEGDEGWETVSEHTVSSDEEGGGWGGGGAAPPDAKGPHKGGGGGGKRKGGGGGEAPKEQASGGGGASGVIPSAEELSEFVAGLLKENPEWGMKRVSQAIKEGRQAWTVGDKRLQKILADLKAGGAKEAKPPVQVEPVALDADGRLAGSSEGMNFNFRSFHSFFDLNEATMAKLVADCKIACRSQSFWLSASMKPRFALERMARAVFDLHTKGLAQPFDPERSGAEWWVHFRGPQERDGEAIGFHWDRDETYADVTRQNVHPQVATVTYLSDNGAPTMILEQVPIPKGSSFIEKAYLSHPQLGKHVSFDGRMLHGVPPELMAPHVEKKKYTRITFLVNIWVNHLLTDTHAFPEGDIPKFSDVEVPCAGTSPPPSQQATVKVPSSSRVRGFAFGGRGEEHELWVPQAPQPQPFCDSVIIDYGAKPAAKVIRVSGGGGGGSGGGGGPRKKKR